MVEKQVRDQLELIVQGAVRTQLEQMARKALPDIAERIVKAEIRKMLEGLANSKD
jgi:predicted nucleic acid-binding OB-fold protein